MTVATRSISIPRDDAGTELIDALQNFAQSRSTKALMRHSENNDLRYAMRVPFYENCRVDPGALARGLRKLMRETIEGGTPGDRAVIDFAKNANAQLVLTVSAVQTSDLDLLFAQGR